MKSGTAFSVKSVAAAILVIVLALSTLVAGTIAFGLNGANKRLDARARDLERANADAAARAAKLEREKESLDKALKDAAAKSDEFAAKLESAQRTADRLEWVSSLDKQLLAKYSKVYFLNENYSPAFLSPIDSKYLANRERTLEVHDWVLPFLQDLMKAAAADGMTLQAQSAYRSFSTQAALKSGYKVTYGSGANAFSADQGYSEHQLGTTVDFSTPALGGRLDGFDKTKAYEWLKQHAHEYGFTLSYPAGNKYYVFEPWHWRFVGVALATKLHNDGKHFYDLDQREIDTYLEHMFDAAQ